MDNIETYLYIALAVIYILSRVLKARKQNAPTRPVPPKSQSKPTASTQQQPRPRKAFSFEDILKEFEKNLVGEEFTDEKAMPVEEIDYEKPKAKISKKVEQDLVVNPYQAYEGASYESPDYNKELLMHEDFSRNENFSIAKDISNQYMEMLRDPEGFKNAIVLSEIINRKYF